MKRIKPDKSRPESFLFNSKSWNGSVQMRDMEPDQIAWYIQLLSDAWESNDTPQATLPDDDPALKKQCRFNKSLSRDEKRLNDIIEYLILAVNLLDGEITKEKIVAMLATVKHSLSTRYLSAAEEQWKEVKKQFKSKDGLIYNERQMSELAAYRGNYEQKIRAGVATVNKKRKASEQLDPEQVIRERELKFHPIIDSECSAGAQQVLSDRLADTQQRGSENRVNSNLILSSKESTQDTNRSTTKKKRVRKESTLVDYEASKFVVTEKIVEHLKNKHKEKKIADGDIHYLAEKFGNVAIARDWKYSGWTNAFYNFVANQFTEYGYKVGSYNGQQIGNQTGGNNGRYETSAERNARINSDNERWRAERLRGGNAGHSDADSDGLQLDTDEPLGT